jgi:Fe-Mn family superoxide dismutase
MRATTSVSLAPALPELPYRYDALEPYIDAQTMEIHHTKHHKTYVDKLNDVLNRNPKLKSRDVAELLQELEHLEISEADRKQIRNHGGGHANHTFFWTIMAPKKQVSDELVSDITDVFGSVAEFQKKFEDVATSHFGSGWAWLVRDASGSLQLYSTDNQDSPLMRGHTPVIGLDVWEHAYYLKYQNRRPEYVKNWWNVLKVV